MITAEADVIRDQGEAFASELRAAGVPVTAARQDARSYPNDSGLLVAPRVRQVCGESGITAEERLSQVPASVSHHANHVRLFGLTAGESTPFSYGDVPELTGVIDYVTSRIDLVKRLDLVPESTQVPGEPKMWLIKLEAADLVLSVVDRARALGRPYDPETLLTAYRERERGILAPELDADLVAPLVLTSLELDEPLELAAGVRLEKLDEATQLARARDHYTIEAVPSMVSGAATHAVVITGVKIDNSSWASRMWRGRGPTIPFGKLDLSSNASAW